MLHFSQGALVLQLSLIENYFCIWGVFCAYFSRHKLCVSLDVNFCKTLMKKQICNFYKNELQILVLVKMITVGIIYISYCDEVCVNMCTINHWRDCTGGFLCWRRRAAPETPLWFPPQLVLQAFEPSPLFSPQFLLQSPVTPLWFPP